MIIRDNQGFTARIPKALIQDKYLSDGAKCLMFLVLSYPDYWVFSLKTLSDSLNKSPETINQLLAELHHFGYFHPESTTQVDGVSVPMTMTFSEYPIRGAK